MDIRTFRAKTMREAIALIRRELGPGAAVLHSREIRRGTIGKMLYGTGVEVTASAELPTSMRIQTPSIQPKNEPDFVPPIAPKQHEVELQLTDYDANNLGAKPSRDQQHKKYEPVNRIQQLEEEQTLPKPMKTGFPLLDAAPLPADVPSSADAPMPADMAQASAKKAIFAKLEERLSNADLSVELIDTLCKQAVIDFEEAQELDLDIVIEHAVQSLAAQLLVANPISIEKQAILDSSDSEQLEEQSEYKRGPKMIALVGPTGVGKTTTIAKLAAKLSVTEGYRVGLITLDSYRVAAIDQLRTYANMLSMPIEVASNADEIHSAMQAMQEFDLVLIDTDGRSPRDSSAIAHMNSLLEELGVEEVHLVLAASTSQRGLTEAIRAFAPAKPTKLLLTKIDETPTLGHIVKTSHDAKLPIGYLTDGQGVPEDLAIAKAESLARSIIRI